jgi:hypothetical protein
VSVGIAGRSFTFTVLFLDEFGAPASPPDALIEVFYFRNDTKNTVFHGTLVSTGEAGRYIKTVTLPDTLSNVDTVYGIMRGTDPLTSSLIVVEQEVSIVSPVKNGAI